MLSDSLIQLGYKRSRGDKDVWMRPNELKTMYDYIGTHTDDLLVISKDVKAVFDELEASFEFKTTSEPEYHLGIDYIKKGGKLQLCSFTYMRECLRNAASILGKPVKIYSPK